MEFSESLLERAKKDLADICAELKVDTPQLSFEEDIGDFLGASKDGIIAVNIKSLETYQGILGAMRHEARHLWQAAYVPARIQEFWLHLEEVDEILYWLSAPEIDARAFARGSVSVEDGLIVYAKAEELLKKYGVSSSLKKGLAYLAREYGVFDPDQIAL